MLAISVRGHKLVILVSFRVFRAEHEYFKLLRSGLRVACEEIKPDPHQKWYL